jgi:hypothetical protein
VLIDANARSFAGVFYHLNLKQPFSQQLFNNIRRKRKIGTVNEYLYVNVTDIVGLTIKSDA